MLEALAGLDEIIVCLYDGDYHFGVAALANSLVRSNFKGFINTAYRGSLPPWVEQLKHIDSNTFYLVPDIIIHFEQIKTEMHLAYYKAYFIRQTFKDFPSTNKIFYFDVDIVISAPWSFFSNWLDDDVCLCLDNSYEYVHHNHPWRKEWKRLAKVESSFRNPVTAYVNSGFIGIKRKSIALLDKWIELTEKFEEIGGNLKEINQNGKSSYKGDQDLLNAAITVCPEIELSLIGKEGMGFSQPAYLMSHAIAKVKPWKKNYLKYLIAKGHKPSHSEKDFFKYCKHPIKLFSSFHFFLKKTNLMLATFFGRYIGY
jgi:hypothetical protein